MEAPTIDAAHARLLYHAHARRTQLIIAALGTNGGTQTITDNIAVIYAAALLDPARPFAIRTSEGAYTLTPDGWELFYAGTGWRRDYYGPGLVQGKPVAS